MIKRRFINSLFLALSLTLSCTHKPTHSSVEESFLHAKEAYEDGSYTEAIKDLKEFRSRHPYSRYVSEADLYIANSHFELHEYRLAALSYQQFAILHPKHPRTPFALYRIGLSYWKEAPSAPNREQDLTAQALKFWKRLAQKYPQSNYLKEVEPLQKEGYERITRSELFVIRYYFRQERWLSCVYRVQEHITKNATQQQNPEFLKEALSLGLDALDKILEDLPEDLPELDQHLLLKQNNWQEARSFFEDTKKSWELLRKNQSSS